MNVPVPILEVHLHDNAGQEDSHAYFGFGTVDFAKAAAGLKAAGFDGVSTIEVNPNKSGESMEQTHARLPPMLQQWRSLWQQA